MGNYVKRNIRLSTFVTVALNLTFSSLSHSFSIPKAAYNWRRGNSAFASSGIRDCIMNELFRYFLSPSLRRSGRVKGHSNNK